MTFVQPEYDVVEIVQPAMPGPPGPPGPWGPGGVQGPTGPYGPTGPVGPQGPPGGFVVADVVQDISYLPAAPAPDQEGMVWLVGAGPYEVYWWNGTAWQSLDVVAGPEGPLGPAGGPGPAGPQGVIGPTGAQGPVGPAGPTGAAGPAGPPGPGGGSDITLPLDATDPTQIFLGPANRLGIANGGTDANDESTARYNLGNPNADYVDCSLMDVPVYVGTQISPPVSSGHSVTIVHNLSDQTPAVWVYDTNGILITSQCSVQALNYSSTRITFNQAVPVGSRQYIYIMFLGFGN